MGQGDVMWIETLHRNSDDVLSFPSSAIILSHLQGELKDKNKIQMMVTETIGPNNNIHVRQEINKSIKIIPENIPPLSYTRRSREPEGRYAIKEKEEQRDDCSGFYI